MNIRRRFLASGLVGLAFLFTSARLPAADELARRATWAPPSLQDVQKMVRQWAAAAAPDQQPLDQNTKAKLDALWVESKFLEDPAAKLEQIAVTIAVLKPEALPLVELCRSPSAPATPPDFEFLKNEAWPAEMRNNLRLLFGRWLAQHAWYDEALAQLDGLAVGDVVDPASLLFYQSVARHRLLQKDACLPGLTLLLENEETIPRRYSTLARLMEADIKPLKVDSLDEVSRMMNEVQRRLDFGRAGGRVRKQEDDVIAKLDKLIKDLEKKRKQQQQQAGGGSSQQQPSRPMDDSKPGGGSGPGEVTPKKIAREGEWGNLPPKERLETLQQISNDLPSHYRQVIEEYFRRLAKEEDSP